MAYGRSLAAAVAGGALNLEALARLPEEEAIAAISAQRGFGRWSAEIYLLFALGRADVFPADDLGLQVGMQRLKRLEARPNRKAMAELTELWRPLRGCGAIFLALLWCRNAGRSRRGADPGAARRCAGRDRRRRDLRGGGMRTGTVIARGGLDLRRSPKTGAIVKKLRRGSSLEILSEETWLRSAPAMAAPGGCRAI